MRLALVLALLLCACSSKPPAPEPELLPCYKVKTFKEFSRLQRKRAAKPNAPLVVRGRKYACVETALPVEAACYAARSDKEFEKLAREQEKRPFWPVKAGKKYYRCIQRVEQNTGKRPS